jgi:hypothetical protein
MSKLYQNGTVELTVAASSKLAILSDESCKVYQKVGHPNHPDSWDLLATTTAGTKYLSAAFSAATEVRIEAGPSEALYATGASPVFDELSDTINTLATEAGVGITGGTGTLFASSVTKEGGIYRTRILIDLTGLASSTTDLDIIGDGIDPAYLAQIIAAESGTLVGGTLKCLEAPVGGVTDIDLYSAEEATGVFDGGIAALTETALLTKGGAWTAGAETVLSAVPAADEYLYLTGGAAGTAAAYTAGVFLLELWGV